MEKFSRKIRFSIFENFHDFFENFNFFENFHWKSQRNFSISKIFEIFRSQKFSFFQKVALTFFIFKKFWWFFFMDRCSFPVRSEWRYLEVSNMQLKKKLNTKYTGTIWYLSAGKSTDFKNIATELCRPAHLRMTILRTVIAKYRTRMPWKEA